MKELLPPVVVSREREANTVQDDAIRLDSREPKYVSYLSTVKQAIELVWEYPDLALRQGIQGNLVLRFTILGDGTLEKTSLIRSSGFSVLDREAVRAIQAAAPFQRLPPWIEKKRLDIIANFEYLDNRLQYGFAQ
jgi:protein TonB